MALPWASLVPLFVTTFSTAVTRAVLRVEGCVCRLNCWILERIELRETANRVVLFVAAVHDVVDCCGRCRR
jgi:hypothetical protein